MEEKRRRSYERRTLTTMEKATQDARENAARVLATAQALTRSELTEFDYYALDHRSDARQKEKAIAAQAARMRAHSYNAGMAPYEAAAILEELEGELAALVPEGANMDARGNWYAIDKARRECKAERLNLLASANRQHYTDSGEALPASRTLEEQREAVAAIDEAEAAEAARLEEARKHVRPKPAREWYHVHPDDVE